MIRKIFIASVAFISTILGSPAQDFHTFFADSTLRVDYTIAGDTGGTLIFLDQLTLDPAHTWAGRRHNLNRLPLKGNGDITVSLPDGTTLYRTSFSTLYSEWLSTPEAETTPRSYENTFLLPYPRQDVDVTVSLYDMRHDTIATLTHRVKPDDILIQRPALNPAPHRYIHKGGSPAEKIDVAILAEGYTVEQMDSFYHHAAVTVASLADHEPFKSMMDRFNFVAVAAPSKDSGVSVPREGKWLDTTVGSHFDTFYSDRYLTTPHVKKIHDALAGIPYEHIIVLANTETYGGGGIYNSYTLTAAGHPLFRPVVVHEFGHSFGGLADEYFYDDDVMSGSYPLDIEPWEQNITTSGTHPKWKHLVPAGTPLPTPAADADRFPVGAFEGGGYSSRGVFRPADHCRMRDNQTEGFCPVCQDAIARIIKFYTEENSDK